MDAIYNALAIPFGYALSLLFQITNNYLLSLLLITLIIRLILLPQSVKQQKNSAKQMRLQAKVNKIRAKYSTLNPREAQMKVSEETQELYRREGFSMNNMGCLPMFIQLAVMMGLYGAIYSPIKLVLRFSDAQLNVLKEAYNALPNIDATAASRQLELQILNKFDAIKGALAGHELFTDADITKIESFIENFKIFGIDLTANPQEAGGILILIPILAGITALMTSLFMYLKQKKTNPEMAKNPAMGCMTLMSPAMSFYFSFSFPAGIGFYWIISNILSFIQTVGLAFALKPDNVIAGQMIDETVARRSRENALKKKTTSIDKE